MAQENTSLSFEELKKKLENFEENPFLSTLLLFARKQGYTTEQLKELSFLIYCNNFYFSLDDTGGARKLLKECLKEKKVFFKVKDIKSLDLKMKALSALKNLLKEDIKRVELHLDFNGFLIEDKMQIQMGNIKVEKKFNNLEYFQSIFDPKYKNVEKVELQFSHLNLISKNHTPLDVENFFNNLYGLFKNAIDKKVSLSFLLTALDKEQTAFICESIKAVASLEEVDINFTLTGDDVKNSTENIKNIFSSLKNKTIKKVKITVFSERDFIGDIVKEIKNLLKENLTIEELLFSPVLIEDHKKEADNKDFYKNIQDQCLESVSKASPLKILTHPFVKENSLEEDSLGKYLNLLLQNNYQVLSLKLPNGEEVHHKYLERNKKIAEIIENNKNKLEKLLVAANDKLDDKLDDKLNIELNTELEVLEPKEPKVLFLKEKLKYIKNNFFEINNVLIELNLSVSALKKPSGLKENFSLLEKGEITYLHKEVSTDYISFDLFGQLFNLFSKDKNISDFIANLKNSFLDLFDPLDLIDEIIKNFLEDVDSIASMTCLLPVLFKENPIIANEVFAKMHEKTFLWLKHDIQHDIQKENFDIYNSLNALLVYLESLVAYCHQQELKIETSSVFRKEIEIILKNLMDLFPENFFKVEQQEGVLKNVFQKETLREFKYLFENYLTEKVKIKKKNNETILFLVAETPSVENEGLKKIEAFFLNLQTELLQIDYSPEVVPPKQQQLTPDALALLQKEASERSKAYGLPSNEGVSEGPPIKRNIEDRDSDSDSDHENDRHSKRGKKQK